MTISAYSLFLSGCELLESGNPAQAAVLLEKASILEPNKASVHETLGRAYYNYGQVDLAHKHFVKVIELNPAEDFGHYCLAKSLYKLGRFKKALKHIKLAVAMKPESQLYQELCRRLQRRAGGV